MNYFQLVSAVQDYCENTFPTADMNAMIRVAEQNIYNTVQLANLRKNVTATLTPTNQYLAAPDDFLSPFSLAVIQQNGQYVYLLNKDVNFIREAYPNPTSTGLPKHYAIFGPSSSNVNELSFILGPTPDLAYGVELHFYYLPESIVQGVVKTITIGGGSGYTNGTYINVPLAGGSGSAARATIVVSAGSITQCVITDGGSQYVVGDVLGVNSANVGGTGGGFSATVTAVANASGTTWLGDNFETVLFNGTMIEAIRYMKGDPDLVQLYQQQYTQSLALLKNLGDGKQRMDAYRDGQVRNPVV